MKPSQATVMSFDEARQTGDLVTDDGLTMPFGAAAFVAGGLRRLRPGQRVRFRRGPDGTVTAVTLLTLPLPADAEEDRA